jgi:hypothetical protein
LVGFAFFYTLFAGVCGIQASPHPNQLYEAVLSSVLMTTARKAADLAHFWAQKNAAHFAKWSAIPLWLVKSHCATAAARKEIVYQSCTAI